MQPRSCDKARKSTFYLKVNLHKHLKDSSRDAFYLRVLSNGNVATDTPIPSMQGTADVGVLEPQYPNITRTHAFNEQMVSDCSLRQSSSVYGLTSSQSFVV